MKAKRPCTPETISLRPPVASSRRKRRETHRESDVDHPLHPAESGPRDPVFAEAFLDFPAAEFAIQPPSLRAITKLEVGKPGRHDRHNCCVETNDGTCGRGQVSLARSAAEESVLTDEADDSPALTRRHQPPEACPNAMTQRPRRCCLFVSSPRAFEQRVRNPVNRRKVLICKRRKFESATGLHVTDGKVVGKACDDHCERRRVEP